MRFHSTRAAQIRHQSARDTSKIKSKASARLGGRRGGRDDGGVCGASQEAAEQTRCDAVFLSICPSNPGETRPDTYLGDLLVP